MCTQHHKGGKNCNKLMTLSEVTQKTKQSHIRADYEWFLGKSALQTLPTAATLLFSYVSVYVCLLTFVYSYVA